MGSSLYPAFASHSRYVIFSLLAPADLPMSGLSKLEGSNLVVNGLCLSKWFWSLDKSRLLAFITLLLTALEKSEGISGSRFHPLSGFLQDVPEIFDLVLDMKKMVF